jgi:hypothetical protein
MESTVIWRHIAKSNKNIRFKHLLWLLGILVLAGWQYRYFRNCFLGPQKITAQELIKLKSASELDRDYVTFTSTTAVDTGFSQVSVSKKSNTETTTEKYALAKVGDEKAILIETKPENDLKNLTFTGSVAEISTDIQTKIIDKILEEAPSLKERMLPVMLETSDYRTAAYFLLPALLGGLGYCGWRIFSAQSKITNPRLHPLYKSLGDASNADIKVNSIDQEFRRTYNLEAMEENTTYVTPSWFMHSSKYNLQLTELDKLMWIYAKVTQHSVNFIPTGKSHEIVMHDRSGQVQIVKLKENDLSSSMDSIVTNAPWAMVGYADEVVELWNKNRDDFYGVVEERKKEIKG